MFSDPFSFRRASSETFRQVERRCGDPPASLRLSSTLRGERGTLAKFPGSAHRCACVRLLSKVAMTRRVALDVRPLAGAPAAGCAVKGAECTASRASRPCGKPTLQLRMDPAPDPSPREGDPATASTDSGGGVHSSTSRDPTLSRRLPGVRRRSGWPAPCRVPRPTDRTSSRSRSLPA